MFLGLRGTFGLEEVVIGTMRKVCGGVALLIACQLAQAVECKTDTVVGRRLLPRPAAWI